MHMKGEGQGFGLKMRGGPLRKRQENHQIKQLVFMKGHM